jgi:diacylglycerol kinase family enzyme
VSVDGGAPVEGELVLVSNIRRYGGLFTLADRARCDSGHLDVCVLERASLPGLLRTGWNGLSGGLSRRRGVAYLTGRRVRLAANEPVAVQVDGDYCGTTPVEIDLLPAHVSLCIPAD